MENGSGADDSVNGVVVWTFIIRGGEPFDLKLKDNMGPVLNHVGKRTIWKMVGTEEQAVSIEEMVKGPLIGARVERFTDVESSEEREIRLQRIGFAPQEG